MKFYKCSHCGQIITKLNDKNIPVVCCGQIMQELIAGTTEASLEKHIPVYKTENNIVTVAVGSVIHPMTEEHYIEWVCLETNLGSQIKQLAPNTTPEVTFVIGNNVQIISVYAYCNLHNLWKA